MDATPLENAVRALLREEMAPQVGNIPGFTSESMERVVDDKAVRVLPVLRESMDEDALPNIHQIHRADLEATRRSMRSFIAEISTPASWVDKEAVNCDVDSPTAKPVNPDVMRIGAEWMLNDLEARLEGGPRPGPQELDALLQSIEEATDGGETPTSQ